MVLYAQGRHIYFGFETIWTNLVSKSEILGMFFLNKYVFTSSTLWVLKKASLGSLM